MPTRLLLITVLTLLTSSCGGGDKHLPSSNPPEYDPKKVYASPSTSAAPSSQPSLQPVKPEPPHAAADVPCEQLPIDPADPEKPPTLCGGGSGGTGGSGGWGGAGGGGETGPPADATTKHPSYRLEFRSAIVSTDPNNNPAQSQASAIVRLDAQHESASGAVPKYTGQGMIAYQTGPLPNWNACDPLVRGQGTIPLRVFQAFIHVDPPQGGANASQGGSAKIELLYGILGMSQETSTGMHYMLNYRCVPNPPELDPFWSTMYVSGRGEVSTDPMKMFLLKDWSYVGKDGVVATKTLTSTCGGMCDQEVATFTLREGDDSQAAKPK